MNQSLTAVDFYTMTARDIAIEILSVCPSVHHLRNYIETA